MIIDASVALKWMIDEPGSDLARALQSRSDLIAPALLHHELANALTKKVRKGELENSSELNGLLDEVGAIVVTLDDLPLIGRSLSLALQLGHSVYDCVYLALAEQLGQELVTADVKFLRKVGSSDMNHLVRAL